MMTLRKEDLSSGLFGGPRQSLNEFFSVTADPQPGAETKISVEKLYPSPKNPFIVEHDEAMDELIASIKAKGILVPLIVGPMGSGRYEIIAGHRRFYAAKAAELTEVPCIVKEMTDEEADIIMVDTNLNRPYIRTSEKAFAYKLKYEAIKKSVGRKKMSEPGSDKKNDASEMSEPGSDKYDSTVEIAKEMGVSDKTIKNYLRLTRLHRSLLELVDRKELPLKAGVQLSYLTELIQGYIFYWIEKENIKVDLELAAVLRKELEGRPDSIIMMEDVLKVMCPKKEEKKLKQKRPAVRLDKAMKNEYFPEGYDDAAIEEVIRKLLDQWVIANNYDYEIKKSQ